MKKKQLGVQFVLVSIGLLLFTLTYFYYPYLKQLDIIKDQSSQKDSENVIDDVGDYEQFHPELYSIANYFELYVLSSTGKDREFYQIFNKNDPCCFAGEIYKIYHEPLKKFISKFDSWNFDIILDDTHTEHKKSENITEFIIQNLLNS